MRRAAVAGQFYPSLARDLEKQVKKYFTKVDAEPISALGGVVPHAGYQYSGRVAASVYGRLPEAETYIILGPNHTGYGSPVAVSGQDWSTPLGKVETDVELVNALPRRIIDFDETAHRYEHSIEVQLPFIQERYPQSKFMGVAMGMQDEETVRDIAEDITMALRETGRNAIIIASSDFTHFMGEAAAKDIDHYVIEAILDLDVEEMYRRVYERNASICGYGPIAAMLQITKELGASEADLVEYATSADATGDTREVVGYAGIIVR